MDQEFDIDITYKGREESFKAILKPFGYSYKIEVDVQGIKILYEPDETQRIVYGYSTHRRFVKGTFH